ncbi:MAG: exodeoxyribonuclease VII large subunit, partial [Bacteroidota bacterium]
MEYSYFSLSEINNSLRQLFQEVFSDPIWIKAEISEIHKNSSGHCYLELIEKDSANTIIARQKATIWANNYKTLEPYFENKTQFPLQAGLEVLILSHIEMHEVYGMSLNIVDINPEYTIGRIITEKERIIKQLTADGVIDLNRSLVFPDLPQRIAVISSETAAGYEDFVHQLESNSYGYKFSIDLFDALMQGSDTEKSVIEAI